MPNSGTAPALCRDCFERSETPRCGACGSPRVLRHAELEALSIAHIDCDAFYAAVEKRDDPTLADKPLIIGGGRRGVVSTACYIARVQGVRSAMPMFKALKLCPDAVVLPPDMSKYAQVSRAIRTMFLELTPQVEPLSLDEAFLDLTGTERLHGDTPAASLARLAARIESNLGVSVSVGLSDCKFLAKIASDLDKPRGFSVIGRAEAMDFLADKPVGLIWGVGAALRAKLEGDGLRRIADLRTVPREDMLRRYGSMGQRLHDLSFARDTRRIDPSETPKSISAETTFTEDINDAELLEAHLWRLAERVSDRAKAKGLGGRTVTLKLKTPEFRTITRSQSLNVPVQLCDVIFRAGQQMLEREPGSYRLLGIGITGLAAAGESDDAPLDLLDPDAGKRAQAERAVDSLRERFGSDAVESGRNWRLKD